MMSEKNMMCDFISVTLVVAGMHANPIFCLALALVFHGTISGENSPTFFELGDMQAMDGWVKCSGILQSEPTTHNNPW